MYTLDDNEQLEEISKILAGLSARDLGRVSDLAKDTVEALDKVKQNIKRLEGMMHACVKTMEGDYTEETLADMAMESEKGKLVFYDGYTAVHKVSNFHELAFYTMRRLKMMMPNGYEEEIKHVLLSESKETKTPHWYMHIDKIFVVCPFKGGTLSITHSILPSVFTMRCDPSVCVAKDMARQWK